MNREEIIRMAAEVWNTGSEFPIPSSDDIERFAVLVAEAEAAKWAKGVKISVRSDAIEQEFSFFYRRGYEAGKALIPAAIAAEREACAKVCLEEVPSLDGQLCAEAIRARGTQ